MAKEFSFTIDRVQSFDVDGLDGGAKNGRADFYAVVEIDDVWQNIDSDIEEQIGKDVTAPNSSQDSESSGAPVPGISHSYRDIPLLGPVRQMSTDTQQEELERVDNETIVNLGVSPDWLFEHTTEGRRDVYLDISIFENDSRNDDQGDINARVGGEKGISLLYNRVTGSLREYFSGSFISPLKDLNSIEVYDRNTNRKILFDPKSPFNEVNGNQFFFIGEYKGSEGNKNNPTNTDRVGVWITLQPPELAKNDGEGNLNLSFELTSSEDGSAKDDFLIKHVGGVAGNEIIDLHSNSFITQHGIDPFRLIRGFAGDGDDTVILDDVKTSAYLSGGKGNGHLEIINSSNGVQSSTLIGNEGDDLVRGGSGNDNIYGGSDNDVLFGGSGSGFLTGDQGSDTIDGDSGDDVIDGGSGKDKIDAGAGEDTVGGGSDSDLIWGGDGDDLLLGDSSPESFSDITIAVANEAAGDVILGGAGNDTVLGEWGDDEIDGGAGDDFLLGGVGDDTINGGAGNDTLEGNDGDDFLDGGTGTDEMSGYLGNDTFVVDNDHDVVVEALEEGTDTVRSSITYTLGEHLENLILIGDETLHGIGNELDNEMQGNSAANQLQGLVGNDVMYGKGGNDTLEGGIGDDILSGGTGADHHDGGAGFDLASYADATGEVIVNLDYGRGAFGEAQGDTYDESIEGAILSKFDDRGVGNNEANIFFGGGGQDFLDGRDGEDALWGEAGADVLDGGAGDDTLNGGEDNDFLNGAEGNDELLGGQGDDYLDGGSGKDTLQGGQGQDWIEAGTGDDVIEGNAGNDALVGGGGNDHFIIRQGDNTNTILDFGGIDTGTNPTEATLAEADILQFEGADLTARNMLLSQIGEDLVIAFEGVADTTVVLENFALENLDNIGWGPGTTSPIGNVFLFPNAPTTDEDFSQFEDVFDVSDADKSSIEAFNLNSVTFCNDLDNEASGFDDSDDVINGLGGADRLKGLSGDDLLRGGDGDDWLIGGEGNDELQGNAGADTFVFQSQNQGLDTLTDFNAAEGDQIQLVATGFDADLDLGILSADYFAVGAAADTNDRFTFDASTGILAFDADGSGAGSAVQIASLGSGATLSHTDLMVV
ncbi:MAG: calcium-binding protein [Leptolyngbyaceae cyanobacterium]